MGIGKYLTTAEKQEITKLLSKGMSTLELCRDQ